MSYFLEQVLKTEAEECEALQSSLTKLKQFSSLALLGVVAGVVIQQFLEGPRPILKHTHKRGQVFRFFLLI